MCQRCREVLAANPGASQLRCLTTQGDYAVVREPKPSEIMAAAAMLMPTGTNLRALLMATAKVLMISDVQSREVCLSMLELKLEAAHAQTGGERLEEILTDEELAELEAAVLDAIRRPQPPMDPRAN